MSQTSKCHNCGSIVNADEVHGGRAYYHCSCGRRWSGRAFYGDDGSHWYIGAIAGGLIGAAVAGPIGGVLGAVFGVAASLPDTCDCLVCGGTGYSTGRNGNIVVYQCKNCLRTWARRKS